MAQSVRFDATGDKYTRSASGLGTTNLTWACWVYLIGDRNNYTAFFMCEGSGYYTLSTDNDGTTFMFGTDDGTSGACKSTHSMALGTWYYVASVNTGANVVPYYAVDGASTLTTVSGGTNEGGSPDNSDTFCIGNTVDGSQWLNGRIAQVKVWTASLTKAELEAEMYVDGLVRTSNIWAYYSFRDGPQTTDESPNSRTLTAAGTLATEDGPPVEAPAVGVNQEGFRWRNDDGSETAATWKAAQDTNISLALATPARLRVLLDATADPDPLPLTLYYRKPTESVVYEDWTGANGSAWSATRWEDIAVASTSVIDVQSNAGRLLSQGIAYAGIRARTTASKTDHDWSFKVTPDSTGTSAEAYFCCGVRVSAWGGEGVTYQPSDGYTFEFDWYNGDIYLMRWNGGGARTTLGSANVGLSAATRWIRIQMIGSSLKVRTWLASGSEPGTWDFSVTDATHTSGRFHFTLFNGDTSTARTATIDDLTDNLAAGTWLPVPVGAGAVAPGIAFIGVSAVATDDVGPPYASTPTWPAAYTPTAGHLAIIVFCQRSGMTPPSTPGGWTALADANSPTDPGCPSIYLYSKFLAGSDTLPTITGSATDRSTDAWTLVYSGVDPMTPLDVAAVPDTNAPATTWVPDPITPITDGAEIVNIVSTGYNWLPAPTPLESFTVIVRVELIGGTAYRSIGIARFAQTTAASKTNPTWTSDTDSWNGITIALRPATGELNPVYIAASSNITAGGQDTTAQLTAPSGKTTADFSVGRMWDDENGTDLVDIGAAPTPPDLVTNLIGWWRSDGAGNSVSQWNDESGNGYHFLQPTAANQLSRTTSTLNGMPVYSAPIGHNDEMQATATNAITGYPVSITCVCRNIETFYAGYYADNRLFSGRPAGGDDYTGLGFYVGGPILTGCPAARKGETRTRHTDNDHTYDNVWIIFTTVFNGSTMRSWVNGVELAVSGATMTSAIDVDIFTLYNPGFIAPGNDYSWRGDVAEIVLWGTADATEQANLEAYLADKWGL